MKRKMVTVTTTNLSTITYIVTALILSTAVIYFVAASQDYSELSSSVSSQSSGSSSISKDALADIIGTTNELIFFMDFGS
jgi:hypothetical protein